MYLQLINKYWVIVSADSFMLLTGLVHPVGLNACVRFFVLCSLVLFTDLP